MLQGSYRFTPKNESVLFLTVGQSVRSSYFRRFRFLHSTAKVLNAVILKTVTLYAMCICTSLLIIEKVVEIAYSYRNKAISIFQYTGSNIVDDLLVPIMSSVFPLITLTLLFYMGQIFHSNVMELNREIYQLKWYQYPRSIRRIVLFMMIRSQQPFFLSAYGIVELHLENFVGVRKIIDCKKSYINPLSSAFGFPIILPFQIQSKAEMTRAWIRRKINFAPYPCPNRL